jgi:hypothetical protein
MSKERRTTIIEWGKNYSIDVDRDTGKSTVVLNKYIHANAFSKVLLLLIVILIALLATMRADVTQWLAKIPWQTLF